MSPTSPPHRRRPLEVVDPFLSWEELHEVLGTGWYVLRDHTLRIDLRNGLDGLAMLEPPAVLRASQRRGLHRAGFRPRTAAVPAPAVPLHRVWLWSPFARQPHERFRWPTPQEDARKNEQAVLVLRDILCAPLSGVSLLPDPDDEWPDDEGLDDDWPDDAP